MNYKFTIWCVAAVFVSSAIASILMAITNREIPERLAQIVMGSMASLASLIALPQPQK